MPVVVISEKLNWVNNFQPKLGTFHLWIGKQVTQQIDPFFPNLKVLGSDGILHIELKVNQQPCQIKTAVNDTPGNKLMKVIIPDSYSSGDTIAITSLEGTNILITIILNITFKINSISPHYVYYSLSVYRCKHNRSCSSRTKIRR